MKGAILLKVYNHKNYNYVYITEIPKSEIEKIDFALCAEPRETLESFYNRQAKKPSVLTNGGFFSMQDGTTAFTYMDEQRIISNQGYNTGIGINLSGNLVYGKIGEISNFRDFISGYPCLIENGKATNSTVGSEINYNARRTCLGYNDSTVFIVTADAPGVNFKVLTQIMLELRCKFAINLDGGGSTRELIDGKLITSDIYSRPVDNVVAVYLKNGVSRTSVFYRVQVGAFLLRGNAESYLKKIQALGSLYKGAYINKDGLYYRVQVGYFSVKSNAENMVIDLKKKGYTAFIKEETK